MFGCSGDRTIMVLTKLDQKYNDVKDVENKVYLSKALKGEISRVKLGIFGVVNNSDNKSNFTMEQWKVKEAEHLCKFFPDIAHEHGIKALEKALGEVH